MAKYPILYAPDATDFFNMGLGPLTTSLTATVSEERNGSFILEAEVLTDDAIYPLLEHNTILKADAGHTLKDQRFKIKRIVPTDKGTAKIYAEHVSYLSQELSLKPEITIKSLNANAAIGRWKSSLNETNPFVVDSDITTTGSTTWRIDKVANPRQALGGVEGSLLDVYGGEYRFDNYHISLLKKRGTTANTVLAYGRNITSFEQELNITDTYTSVYPYAIYTDKNDNEQMVTIDGYVVDCENVSSFPNRVVKIVDFSSEFEHDEVPTKAKLQTLAEQYVTANDFGTPKVSIKVSFVDLSKAADYAEYQALEEVNLCDDVRVIFPKLGVNTVAKVTRTVWNVLSESYDEIEIGEKRASLSTIINDQGKQIGEAEKNANGAIIAANGKNTIFFGLYGADGLGEPVANKLGDTWYKPNGEDTETYIWNGTIWEQIASTAPDPALIALIEENKRLVEEAQSAAEDAQKAGEDAQKVADEAKGLADQAGVDAGQALDKANDAVSKANDATQKVGGLETAVGLVTEQSANAVDVANQAKGNADTALGKANSAIGTAQDALNQSALAKSQAEEAIEKYLGMGMVPAWSWSADGTDRFTTVYPNLNLLDGTKDFSGTWLNSDFWTTDGTYKGLTVKKRTEQWKGIYKTFTAPKDGVYTFSAYVKASGNTTIIYRYGMANGITRPNKRIGTEFDWLIDSDSVTLQAGQTAYFRYEITTANTDAILWVAGYKWEQGLTATIYTPSPSEDYANAVPSYIGFAIEPSDNPADYTWIRNPEKVEGEVKVELTDINGELKRKVSQETFDQLNSTVINHSTLISQNQNAIKLKADQSTVDTINQTVADHSTAIDLNAEAIALKANQSTVDSLTGRVTEAEGSITTIAGQVALKANQSVVDTMTNTVNANSSELTVQAGKITALTTKTDGHTSQISSLGDAINFRITNSDGSVTQLNLADKVISLSGEQVNITGNTYISNAVIKTANIVDLNVTEAKLGNLSVSTAKIADAAITSAKIGTAAIGTAHIGDGVITNAKIGNLAVSGAKIQDATISSAKIINLDASKITANTLSAITTNTGALNVTGWLTFATENRGLLGSYDFGDAYGEAYNPRWFVGDYRLSHRHLIFTGKGYNVTSSNTRGSYLYDLETFYGIDYLKMRQYNTSGTLLNRIDINADAIVMSSGAWGSDAKSKINADGSAYFAEKVTFAGGIDVGSPNNVGLRVGRIDAPLNYNSISINAERAGLCDVQFGADNIQFNLSRTGSADFRIGKDGSSINGGRVVQSSAVYNRTYSGTANMIVLDTGTIGRTTSARKYKADIKPAYDVIAHAKKVLSINPSSWWDKGELADGVAKERYYGFIADEFAEAGLNEVVVYRDGEIESLAYDRIPMYHNVILSEHEKEILALKAKVQQLENEIRVLQAA